MNREIKFRGSSTQNNKWYYGCPIFSKREPDIAFILSEDGEVTVHSNSVGMFTGFKDKNGVEVYEDDIVTAMSQGYKGVFRIWWRREGSPCWLLYPAFQNREFWYLSVTEYGNGKQFIDVTGNITSPKKEGCYDDGVEVIGNMHANPELLHQHPHLLKSK